MSRISTGLISEVDVRFYTAELRSRNHGFVSAA
jgi:hypothetical protein